MNEKKWQNYALENAGDDVTVLFPKLIEEVGEVGKAIAGSYDEINIDMELSHVIFIAELWRWQLKGGTEYQITPPKIRP
jgi:NTP pyrophosphatase (non-canonical NTP hydrolase)